METKGMMSFSHYVSPIYTSTIWMSDPSFGLDLDSIGWTP